MQHYDDANLESATTNTDINIDFSDENLETLMTPDDDVQPENDADDDAAFAQLIVDECQGTLEDGTPKTAIALSLEMVNLNNDVRRTLAQQGMYKPVVTIYRRMEFIEITLTFPSAVDSNLRVLMSNLAKYGDVLNELTQQSTEYPVLSIVFLPLSSLGTYYMSVENPIMWSLQPAKAGSAINQVKLIVRGENVNFYQTDEMNLATIIASIQREEEEAMRTAEVMAERDAQRRAHENQMDALRQLMQEAGEDV